MAVTRINNELICSECNKKFSRKELKCPFCNASYNSVKGLKTSNVWNEQKNKEKEESQSGTIILAITVVFFSALFASTQDDSSYKVSKTDSISVCKAYIGSIFSKPTSIIRHYHTDNSGNIFVSYTRQSDNSDWSHLCKFEQGKVTWAAWLKDEERVGRWRTEDAATLNYNRSNHSISFISPASFNSVSVKLTEK